jgi:ArsR family transcriptional regulator, arsenate/arsenite/antimonite-responsive transcriptional repressor
MRDIMAITKALSDESRIRILMALRNGELCVCQIIGLLQLAPSTVSKHMAILHQARLVEARKEGRWMYYRLPGREAPKPVTRVLRWLRDCLEEDGQTAEDARRLKTLLKCNREKLSQCYHQPVHSRRSTHDSTRSH